MTFLEIILVMALVVVFTRCLNYRKKYLKYRRGKMKQLGEALIVHLSGYVEPFYHVDQEIFEKVNVSLVTISEIKRKLMSATSLSRSEVEKLFKEWEQTHTKMKSIVKETFEAEHAGDMIVKMDAYRIEIELKFWALLRAE